MHPVAPNPYDWNFYALSLLCVLVMLLLLVPLFRRLPTIYGIFTVLFFVMPLTTGSLQSSARFMLGMFPLYLLHAIDILVGGVRDVWSKQRLIRYNSVTVQNHFIVPACLVEHSTRARDSIASGSERCLQHSMISTVVCSTMSS